MTSENQEQQIDPNSFMGKRIKKFDPKMLDLDEISTPGELSMDENDGHSEANGDSDESEVQREDRPHESFLIK